MDTSLKQEIEQNGGLNDIQAKMLIACFLSGFDFLHQYDIVHGDIKPDNILVKNGIYKLCDFGLSQQMPNKKPLQVVGGTFSYSHPLAFERIFWREIGLNKAPKGNIPWAIDLYSIGITIFEAITAEKPFRASNHANMHRLHCNKGRMLRGIEEANQYIYFDLLPPSRVMRVIDPSVKKLLVHLIRDCIIHVEAEMISFDNFFRQCTQILFRDTVAMAGTQDTHSNKRNKRARLT